MGNVVTCDIAPSVVIHALDDAPVDRINDETSGTKMVRNYSVFAPILDEVFGGIAAVSVNES